MTLIQSPYLREQRQFPNTDLKELSNQSDHAYIDIAQKVNVRTIGIFALGFSVINGESWYLSGSSLKQQALRQIYTFTTSGSIPHGLDLATIPYFSRISGNFYDGTNWYPLPYVDVNAANNQVNIIIDPTNIVITRGGGTPPAITKGIVILEWLSQV